MGSSSSKKKEKEKEIENEIEKEIIKNNENNTNEDRNKINNVIENNYRRIDSNPFTYEQKKEDNFSNIPIKTFESKISAPIQQKKSVLKILDEKDYNLELTNYFNYNDNISEDKNLQESYKIRFQQILNKINNRPLNQNNYMININEKINSNFGLQKLIQDDFSKTKTYLLYCSSLDNNDEIFINGLDYKEYLKNEQKYRVIIENIINRNKREIIKLLTKK